MTANTCPTCTDTLCPACQAAADYADLLAQWAAYDEGEATDRYNAEQWALSGTNYNDGWFSGYRVGR